MSDLKLVLDKEDESGQFAAVSTAPRWAFMKMAVAEKKRDDMGMMAAMYDLAFALVKPEDRGRFDEYMDNHPEGMDLLQDAIVALCEVLMNRPLEPSSSSVPPSTPTENSSRVVSFSRGTVEVAPEVEVLEEEKRSSTA